MTNKYTWTLEQLLDESYDRLMKPVVTEDPSTKMFLEKEQEPAQVPRVKRVSMRSDDGSTKTKWVVVDYRGQNASGQGADGFDSPIAAKDFLTANMKRLSAPKSDLGESVRLLKQKIIESQFEYSNIPTLRDYRSNKAARDTLHTRILKHCWDNSRVTLESRESILKTIESKIWKKSINESYESPPDNKKAFDASIKKLITSVWNPISEKNLKKGMKVDVVEVENTASNIVRISVKENKTIKEIQFNPGETLVKFTDGSVTVSNFSTYSFKYGVYFCTNPGTAMSGINWITMKTERVDGYRKYGNLFIDLPSEGPYDRIMKKLGESEEMLELLDEDLRKWFKEKWVRFNPQGKIMGPCARGDDSEGKPKCLPQKKAQALGKKARASAAARKRREDPNPERSGKAINVNTKSKRKSNESVTEARTNLRESTAFVEGCSWEYVVDWLEKNIGPTTLKNPNYYNGYMGEGWRLFPARYSTEAGKPALVVGVNDNKLRHHGIQGEEQLKQAIESDCRKMLEELKCWPGYTRVRGVPAGAPGSCKKKTKTKEGVAEEGSYKRMKCPECGGAAYGDEILAEKKDACYHKVKSRYKVWPSAYACVPEETSKALTRDGWKTVDALSVGDEIMTYSMEKDIMEFKPILNLHRYSNAPTTVVKSGNTGFMFECTPNHKWVVKMPEQKSDRVSKYEKVNGMALIETSEMLEVKNNKHLVVTAPYEGGNPLRKDKMFKYGDNWTKYILDITPEQRQSWVFSAIVYDGNQIRTERVTENKGDIDDLDWMYSGNHGKQSFGFKQKDVEHRDAFLLAAFLNGGTVTWKEHNNRDIYSCYYVSNKRYKNLWNFKSVQDNITDVWCPETENNTWVMMQETDGKGIITITGNSGALSKCRKVGASNWGNKGKK